MTNGVIDLRPSKRNNRKPVRGQEPLFSPRPPTPVPRSKSSRPKPLRARKRRARILSAFLALLLLAGAAWDVSAASYMPRFSVQAIEVTGAQSDLQRSVHDYAWSLLYDGSHHYLSRANMFLYPQAVIERDIVANFPRIASAAISRDSLFSTTLDVSVVERQQFALWCAASSSTASPFTDASSSAATTGETCYQMDAAGFIFAPAQGASASTQYMFQGGLGAASTSSTSSQETDMPLNSSPIGQTFVPAHLPGIVALMTELGQAGFAPAGATILNDTDFSIPLAPGFYIKASFGEDPATLVSNLQLILSSQALQGEEDQLEYVDLRFGDRVYYKLKGQSETSSPTQ